MSSPARHRPRVVIAGGGIAGVETMLALRELAGARLSIELLAPEHDLVFRPLAVAAPFGTEEVRRYPLDAICADTDVHLRRDALEFVDVVQRTAETLNGHLVEYDKLVVAVGAKRRAALPGALTFDGRAGIAGFRAVLEDRASGAAGSVAFAVPDGVTWALPLYELALMTSARLPGTRIVIATPESAPLEAFGGAASRRLHALLDERGIELHLRTRPHRVANGFLITSALAIRVDRVVALPTLEGPRIGGIPAGPGGFIAVDEHGAVAGAPGVYAAGDGTTNPIKQGGLAAQQADALAEAIAADAGAPCIPQPFRPELRAQLLTGSLPLWLRGDETSRTPLWWPAGKIAARYLAPYLADRPHWHLGVDAALRDVEGADEVDAAEHEAAVDLALMLADDEADAGEFELALRWLSAAEAIAGALPPEYVGKRRRWSGAEQRPPVRELGTAWR